MKELCEITEDRFTTGRVLYLTPPEDLKPKHHSQIVPQICSRQREQMGRVAGVPSMIFSKAHED
jgi:hypothetical protein